MSYDVSFLRCADEEPTPESVRQRLDEVCGREESAENPLTIEQRKVLTALVADLLALDPYLKSGDSENEHSPGLWISSDDERCHIPDIDIGYERSFTWISYSASSDIFVHLQRVVAVFEHHGYVAYDHQADDIISTEDIEALGAGFDDTKTRVVSELESRGEVVIKPAPLVAGNEKRAWWRFW